MVEELRRLFDKYLEKIQDFKKESNCKELVPVCELNGVMSLCKLFDSLAKPENGVSIFFSQYRVKKRPVKKRSVVNYSSHDALISVFPQVDPSDSENYVRMIELWFQFCMIWSLCCSVDEDGRKKIDTFIREMEGSFPNKDTIYEYYVDPKQKTWTHWEEKLRGGWKYTPG